MRRSEPLAGRDWLRWRPVGSMIAPRTRALVRVRSRRCALVRIGGLRLRLRPGRSVLIRVPVDHDVPVLGLGRGGLVRGMLRVASNLAVDEAPAPPRLDSPTAAAAASLARRSALRADAWDEARGSALRRLPARPPVPPGLGRPAVPSPQVRRPPELPTLPPACDGCSWPGRLEVPRWPDLVDPARTRKETT